MSTGWRRTMGGWNVVYFREGWTVAFREGWTVVALSRSGAMMECACFLLMLFLHGVVICRPTDFFARLCCSLSKRVSLSVSSVCQCRSQVSRSVDNLRRRQYCVVVSDIVLVFVGGVVGFVIPLTSSSARVCIFCVRGVGCGMWDVGCTGVLSIEKDTSVHESVQ